MKKLSILSILILMCTAVVANADVLAFDDFSSGDESGGFGWAAEWTDHDGNAQTLNFSTTDPLNDGISAEYISQGETLYALREFATPLSASTIPELWSSIYLRPENLADGGWMFGFELRNGDEYGAICGLMYSENNWIRLGDIHAGNRVGDGTSEFVIDQETMLVMRFYKNDPGDTVWNRVDLYADLDGTDGRYNNEVAIATGYDLGGYSPEELTHYRINQSGFLTDWDFVAVGTDKESVIYAVSPFVVIDQSDDSTIVEESNETTDGFTVVLTQDPSTVVEIRVDPNSSDDIQLVGAGGVELPIILTFTTSDWFTPQPVTVQAVDDADPEGQESALIKFTGSSTNSDFNGLLGFLSVTVVDNDVAVVVVDDGDGVEVNEQGETSDSYTFVLDYPPTADVMITIGGTGDDPFDPNLPEPLFEVTVNGKSRETLTFTTGNWDTAQTVTVTAVDDTDVEADPHSATIAHRVFSDDLGYDGLAVDNVEVAIQENDCGSWGHNQMDFNHDCYVDLLDFAGFAAAWLNCTQPQVLGCFPPSAAARTVAYDDFSSGDESGGFGWATDWTDDDGTPITLNFSTADPLSDGISAQYLSQGELIAYPLRALAPPLNASTTPEVWAGVYLRPNTLADTGWMIGFQVTKDDDYGGMCGLILGDNNDYIRLANAHAGSPAGDGTSQFIIDQETMLVMRFYKNDPTDTMYNRVDLYADLDGTDGRYNNEVVIATGYDLGSFSTDEISFLRINQSGYYVDWDFVAIGTAKESVINPGL